MEYYRHVYHFSKRWDGKTPLKGKDVIIYCEQGFGDIIQFIRYAAPLKEHGCKVLVHAPVELHPVLQYVDGVDGLLDKKDPKIPEHDFHVPSLSLPEKLYGKPPYIPTAPYIKFPRAADIGNEWKRKIGVVWEGSVQNSMNDQRSCPLKHFKALVTPDTGLFMLQNKVISEQFCRDVEFDLHGINIEHFGHVAELINAVDYVVTVDTAALHLAGAMGKRTFGILCEDADPRWNVAKWYDSVVLIKSPKWEDSLNMITQLV